MENKHQGCRRRLQQIISILIFSFNMVVFYTCTMNHLPNPNTCVALTSLFSVCSFALFLCTVITYVLPTTPPKDSGALACPGFCRLCELPMPPLTKHCRTCNKCTMGFDHHCNWIDKCIGLRNYRWFVGMVGTAFGQGLLGAVAAIWALNENGVEEYGWAIQAILGVIVDAVVIAMMVYVGVKQIQSCSRSDRNIMATVHPQKKSTLDTQNANTDIKEAIIKLPMPKFLEDRTKLKPFASPAQDIKTENSSLAQLVVISQKVVIP